jgi:hypothetical protein
MKEITIKDWQTINRYLGIAGTAQAINDEYLSKAAAAFERTQEDRTQEDQWHEMALEAWNHLVEFINYAQIVLNTDVQASTPLYELNRTRAKLHLRDFQAIFNKLYQNFDKLKRD